MNGRYMLSNKKINARLILVLLAGLAFYAILKLSFQLFSNGDHFLADRRLEPSWIESAKSVNMADARSEEIEKGLIWRSVYGAGIEATEQDQSLISLNPIDQSLMPVIWNTKKDRFVEVKPPSFLNHPEIKSLQVMELLAFSSGLAAAKVHFIKNPPSNDLTTEHERKDRDAQTVDNNPLRMLQTEEDLWGFVNEDGNWVIPPVYKNVSKFVGDIAVVEQRHPADYENAYLKLMHKSGKLLAWSAFGSQGWKTSAELVKLSAFGKYVLVNQIESWLDTGYGCCNSQQDLVKDRQMIPIPGNLADSRSGVGPSDPSGTLFMVVQSDKSFLWNPKSGEIKLPGSALPIQPLTANAIAIHSEQPGAVAIQNLDGRIVADGLMFTYPLSETYFVACPQDNGTGSGVDPDMLLNMDAYGRSVRPRYHPYARCGVMDSEGKWRIEPLYEMIDKIGPDLVRLQTGLSSCIKSLHGDFSTTCTDEAQSRHNLYKLRPVLDMRDATHTPRMYGYQLNSQDFAIAPRFALASAFYGDAANVVENNQPGLIDSTGKWLTPRLSDTQEQQASQYLAVAHQFKQQYGNTPKITKVMGVKDTSGAWVVKPLFSRLFWYEDGTLLACNLDCQHIDIKGNLLQLAAQLGTLNEEDAKKEKIAETPPTNADSKQNQLVAVSINNGKWGYQRSGSWVIQPQYDDANDFINGKAEAAVLKHQEEHDNMPAGDYLAWGVIDENGKWITPPSKDAPTVNDTETNQAKSKYPFLEQYALAESDQIPVAQYTNPLGVVVDIVTLNSKGHMSVTFAKGDELRIGLVNPGAKWVIAYPYKKIADNHRSRQ